MVRGIFGRLLVPLHTDYLLHIDVVLYSEDTYMTSRSNAGYAVENRKTGRKGFAFNREQMKEFNDKDMVLVRYSDKPEVLYSVKREKLKMISYVD